MVKKWAAGGFCVLGVKEGVVVGCAAQGVVVLVVVVMVVVWVCVVGRLGS